MKLFTIIHPSRSRAIKSYNSVCNWMRHYSGRIENLELIVSLDEDDPQLTMYLERYLSSDVIVNKNKSCVEAINKAAQKATGQILIVASDDTDMTPSWNKDIMEVIEGKIDWILKTQDGIQPWLITMPVLDRAYYNRFGYIYHPDYLHMFCDTELTCVADITGRKITSNLLFPHKHYSVTKEQPDAINKKADATWAQGEKLFLERYKRNFDLPKGGKIQDKGMIDWLQRKVR